MQVKIASNKKLSKEKISPCFKNHTQAKNWKAAHKFIESNVMLGLSSPEDGQID